jgi:adenylosuccinate lyase
MWALAQGEKSLSTSPYDALSSLDGRYRSELTQVASLWSEKSLNRARVQVESGWILALSNAGILKLSKNAQLILSKWFAGQELESLLEQVKDHETKTAHDVKAVEYAMVDGLKVVLGEQETIKLRPWVHFACTSEDINNLAYALLLKQTRDQVILPKMNQLVESLKNLAVTYADVPMLSHTHGQPASPTTFGKEIAVFCFRLRRQIERLSKQVIFGKMNGAVGAFNAHMVSFPKIDWELLTKRFIESDLMLTQNPLTTQIENHDSLVEYLESIRHFNQIVLGLDRDLWTYISMGYVVQRVVEGETGSSTMPHKVNPIHFENSEGNVGLANSLLSHLSEKLLISRLQRDLSDSTVMRSLGLCFGYSVLSWSSCLKGLARIDLHKEYVMSDLQANWEVLGEAVQTVLRAHGVTDAYERLKLATRGLPLSRSSYLTLIDQQAELPEDVKQSLRLLTPQSYIGIAPKLAQNVKSMS